MPQVDPQTQPVRVGDVINTGEVVFQSDPIRDHDVVFNATLADDPYGANCVKLEGPRTFTVAQLRRAAIRMQEMADIVEAYRKSKGFDE